MDHRLASLLLLAAGALCIPSASARNAEINPSPDTEAVPGYRTEASESGFRLVTLGVWLQPEPAPSAVSVPDPSEKVVGKR